MGAYKVIGRPGEGGMGLVYEAWDDRLGRAVALIRSALHDGRVTFGEGIDGLILSMMGREDEAVASFDRAETALRAAAYRRRSPVNRSSIRNRLMKSRYSVSAPTTA